jgi:hypothetical protein
MALGRANGRMLDCYVLDKRIYIMDTGSWPFNGPSMNPFNKLVLILSRFKLSFSCMKHDIHHLTTSYNWGQDEGF